MTKKFKHKHSSNKIRAKAQIFKGSDLEKSYNSINTRGNVLCHDELDIFRKTEKATVAAIERDASNHIKRHLKINEPSMDIIRNNFNHKNPYVIGFFECLITCYNKAHSSSLIIDLSAVYKSKEHPKLMQQARVNCEKSLTAYVDKVLTKMKSNHWKNVTKIDVDKFEAITPAVNFFCDYIEFLTIGTIPKNISYKDFAVAVDFDPNIENYYSNNRKNCCYTLNKKANNKINNFNQKCLTFLFCKYNQPKK